MKFNFRKIASVLASVVMLGSTVGIAAAANYPAPFVSAAGGDVAIIYGNGAMASDFVEAGLLSTNLATELGKLTASGGTSTTASASGGDSVQVTKSSDKLNLGDGLTDIWGTAITKSDLKVVLADGKFYNKQNTEYKYTQKVDLGNLTFNEFSDSDYQNRLPTIGFQLSANTFVANYTLDFITDPEATQGTDLTDFENKNIELLGKNYYILDFKNSTAKITLLDSASTTSLNEGESKTVSVGDKEYAVSVGFITTDEVILTINGENTDKLSATGTTYGNTYKLSDGTYVGVKSVNVQAYAGGTKSVEFSIGKGKLEITDSSNIKINDKTITDLYGYISLSYGSSKRTWQKLVIKWQIEDEAFLTPNKELTMPGFEAIKLSMANNTIPATETTRVLANNEVLELKTTIKSGDVTIPIVYLDTTTGNLSGIGKSKTQRIATTNTTTMVYNATASSDSQYEGFIASWASTKEAETYYLKASVRYDADGVRNLTTITDKVTGQVLCEDVDPASSGVCNIGNVALTINKINYTSGGDRLVGMTLNAGGSFQKVYTKEGMTIYLPFMAGTKCGNNCVKGALNMTTPGVSDENWTSPTSTYPLFLSEEDKDGTLDQSGTAFNVSIGKTGTTTYYITVSDVLGDGTAYETPTSGSKMWESYVASDLGTKILWDKSNSNQYSADLEYHGGQIYANVFVAAPSATVSGGGTTTPGGTVTELGDILVKDSEVSSVSTKNLIVVGGSCVNKVAEKILGGTAPICGADFTAKTNVSANQALIKVVDAAIAGGTTGKVAMLIAGYEAADTIKAAKYVRTEKPATDKDTTKTLSTSGTVATVVV